MKFHPINFSRQRLLKCPRIFKLKIGANSRSGSLTMTGTSRWVGTIIESSSLTAPVFIQISISIVERTRNEYTLQTSIYKTLRSIYSKRSNNDRCIKISLLLPPFLSTKLANFNLLAILHKKFSIYIYNSINTSFSPSFSSPAP